MGASGESTEGMHQCDSTEDDRGLLPLSGYFHQHELLYCLLRAITDRDNSCRTVSLRKDLLCSMAEISEHPPKHAISKVYNAKQSLLSVLKAQRQVLVLHKEPRPTVYGGSWQQVCGRSEFSCDMPMSWSYLCVVPASQLADGLRHQPYLQPLAALAIPKAGSGKAGSVPLEEGDPIYAGQTPVIGKVLGSQDKAPKYFMGWPKELGLCFPKEKGKGLLGQMLSPQGCRDEDVMLGMLQGAAQPVGEREAHTELCFAERLPSHRRLNRALRGSQHCAILLRQKCLASPACSLWVRDSREGHGLCSEQGLQDDAGHRAVLEELQPCLRANLLSCFVERTSWIMVLQMKGFSHCIRRVAARKWHRNGIKKPRTHRYESLKGVDPKFLRNMRFAKKHNKKGLKKMQANNAKQAALQKKD
ncbi:60S ribosomal protein L29 [Anas platyrhynchos]|uniref:Large ribosomal subunit protein eL29 n=1 Tax=Anas platyrhynchos TaxID=8839 RepID=R0LAC1_ANAPL|nr:60S ribosomal protein L29 [Anas platyrhynchos]